MSDTMMNAARECFEDALRRKDDAHILMQLVFAIYGFQTVLTKDIQELKTLSVRDKRVTLLLNSLEQKPSRLLEYLGLGTQSPSEDIDPLSVLNAFRELWQQPDWSARIVLEDLLNSQRALVVILQGHVDLLQDMLSDDDRPLLKSLAEDVAIFRSIHELGMRYVKTDSR